VKRLYYGSVAVREANGSITILAALFCATSNAEAEGLALDEVRRVHRGKPIIHSQMYQTPDCDIREAARELSAGKP
jgi:hypothetical protein